MDLAVASLVSSAVRVRYRESRSPQKPCKPQDSPARGVRSTPAREIASVISSRTGVCPRTWSARYSASSERDHVVFRVVEEEKRRRRLRRLRGRQRLVAGVGAMTAAGARRGGRRRGRSRSEASVAAGSGSLAASVRSAAISCSARGRSSRSSADAARNRRTAARSALTCGRGTTRSGDAEREHGDAVVVRPTRKRSDPSRHRSRVRWGGGAAGAVALPPPRHRYRRTRGRSSWPPAGQHVRDVVPERGAAGCHDRKTAAEAHAQQADASVAGGRVRLWLACPDSHSAAASMRSVIAGAISKRDSSGTSGVTTASPDAASSLANATSRGSSMPAGWKPGTRSTIRRGRPAVSTDVRRIVPTGRSRDASMSIRRLSRAPDAGVGERSAAVPCMSAARTTKDRSSRERTTDDGDAERRRRRSREAPLRRRPRITA